MLKHVVLIMVMVSTFGAVIASEQDSPAYLPLDGVPPSPASLSGERQWPDPAFTHWPALMYDDEQRNAALSLPLREGGIAGELIWRGEAGIPFQLPTDGQGDRISALMAIPQALGVHHGHVVIGSERWSLQVRVVDVHAEPWPLTQLHGGFPADDDNVPVVIRLRRDYGQGDRRWQALRPRFPRGTDPALIIGDPLLVMDQGIFPPPDVGIELHPIDHDRPHHAALLAWAQRASQQPRTVVWSPGNGAIENRRWTTEELRVLEAINQVGHASGALPRRVLVVPPLPTNPALVERARERNAALRYHAAHHGWQVVDAARLAGNPNRANALAPGVYTRYPRAEAQEAIRTALARQVAE